MTQTLKPCPFCGGNSISFRNTPDMDTDGKFHRISCNECGASSRATFAMDACPIFFEELSKAWNTRPAPAATDTGLETVGHMVSHDAELGQVEDAVVYRSQAEELLAAERAKVRHWQEQYTEMHSQFIDLAKSAEADNAAKDARIKELESKLETATALVTCCCGDPVDAHNMGSGHSPVDQYHYTMMQLEAKLAAAEKAARAAHETLIEINPSNYNHDDVCQQNDASVEAIFLLADILGETHGKTKEWWDERRAVLGGKPS